MMIRRTTTDDARGFTLVELLIVISILALLATVALFAMAGATQQAKTSRTNAQIARLHELIMEEWEQYETRRPSIRRYPNEPAAKFAQRRLNALRELMRLEFPDRISDVRIIWNNNGQPTNQPRTAAELAAGVAENALTFPQGLRTVPSKTRAFDRIVRNANGNQGYAAWTSEHQGAECLYMIIKRIPAGDGTALQFFAEKEVGDKDEDGMPEIWDAWGNPINFLRWAPGYQSPIQTGMAGGQPDPFDLTGRGDPRNRDVFPSQTTPYTDNDTYALIPLIYSSGPDGKTNILDDFASGPLLYRDTDRPPYNSPVDIKQDPLSEKLGVDLGVIPNDPYVVWNGVQLGSVVDPGLPDHIDNITNHWISTSIN